MLAAIPDKGRKKSNIQAQNHMKNFSITHKNKKMFGCK